jgi:CreA protein
MKLFTLFIALYAASLPLQAEEIGEVTTSGIMFKDSIEIHAFKDPSIDGITCHVTLPDTALSMEDPTDSSIACRQTKAVLKGNVRSSEENVFDSSKGLFFKKMRVDRFYDKTNDTLVYIAYTKKLRGDNASHSLSTVPLYAAKVTK